MNKFKEVANGKFRGFLDEDEPFYLYIIKSGHINGQGLENQIYYVIEEDPYEPGKTEHLTKREIEKKYGIEL